MRNPALVLVFPLLVCPAMYAQSHQDQTQAAPSAMTDVQKKNLQEYVELLRSDVRQQKAEIMGAMMALNIAESAKFWPIYNEYDGELTKLNNQRLADIKEYAANYDSISDARADELIQNAFAYRKERTELLAKYYGRMKDALGAVEAARFLQVEDQLLELIDLQIAISEIRAQELIDRKLLTLPIEPAVLDLLTRAKLVRGLRIVNGLTTGNLSRALEGASIGTLIRQ